MEILNNINNSKEVINNNSKVLDNNNNKGEEIRLKILWIISLIFLIFLDNKYLIQWVLLDLIIIIVIKDPISKISKVINHNLSKIMEIISNINSRGPKVSIKVINSNNNNLVLEIQGVIFTIKMTTKRRKNMTKKKSKKNSTYMREWLIIGRKREMNVIKRVIMILQLKCIVRQ